MWIMGIDMGTSGCKAVVFDEKWNVVCQAYREYLMHYPGEGLLELDAELVWSKIQEVIREANSLSEKPVEAIAVSAIGDVIIPVDENGNSLRYSIIDFDPRGDEQIKSFVDRFGEERFYNINGMPPLYIGSLAKILWIRDNEPEIFAKTKRWATYEDFIIGKMGLTPTASYSEVSRTMLFDIREKKWSAEILNEIPLSETQLPKAVPSGTVIGVLDAGMQKELGFSAQVTVLSGGHDMVCAAVGAGLDEQNPDIAIDIAGTIEGIIASLPEANTSPTMLENKFPCYIGHNSFITFSVNLTAGCVVRWYRDYIARDEYEECKKNGTNFYEYMQRTMNPEQPGRVLLLPHFSGSGNPFFNPSSMGVIYGLTLDTPREEIGRALIEGLSYEIKLHLEAYENAGMKFKAIRAVGGGASIDSQLQLKANITGLTVYKGSVTESSAMGAAAYAAVGMGVLKNPADAYHMVKSGEKVFTPDISAYNRFLPSFERYKELAYIINGFEKNE